MIDILLSTYQSEKYLENLLNSLLNQSYKDWRLIVRDDYSQDRTPDILLSCKQKYPDKINLIAGAENIGVIKSFEYLLSASTADYIMFCDHDDIWLSHKIETTFFKMKKTESLYKNMPVLIHTDLTVVDENENVLAESFWKLSKLNQKLLSNFNYLGVCNGVTGCTVMINKAAKEISLPFPENISMHDSWIALCVCRKGKIAYIESPTILYRQHDNNNIGAKEISLNYYIKNKILSLSEFIETNKKQRILLKQIGYNGFLKYYYYKILYFFKARL